MNTPIIEQHSSQYRCQSWCVRVSCDGGGGDARQHDKWWLITAQLQPADTGPDRITTLLYWGQPRATVLHQPSQENKEEKHCSFLLVLDYAEVRGPLQCGCQWSSHHVPGHLLQVWCRVTVTNIRKEGPFKEQELSHN